MLFDKAKEWLIDQKIEAMLATDPSDIFLRYSLAMELEKEGRHEESLAVFRELMAYLTRQRLIAPGYTVMQEMIGDVLQREKERLIYIAKSHLTDDAVTALNALLR